MLHLTISGIEGCIESITRGDTSIAIHGLDLQGALTLPVSLSSPHSKVLKLVLGVRLGCLFD